MRGYRSFCWYWWNRWPSHLFFSFQNGENNQKNLKKKNKIKKR